MWCSLSARGLRVDYDEWVASLTETGQLTVDGYKVYADTQGMLWVSDSDADIFVDAKEYQIVSNENWIQEGF